MYTVNERTNVLPLRWFGNIMNTIAAEFLIKAIRLAEKDKYGPRYYTYMGIQTVCYIPAEKWATYYVLDEFKDDEIW
jgi:hypothetical protein